MPSSFCASTANSIGSSLNTSLQKPFTIIEIANHTATIEHEASTSKIGEDQIFYCKQRGLSGEQAVSMIVSGFCREVFKELPMEFALEAQQLLGITLEGSVG